MGRLSPSSKWITSTTVFMIVALFPAAISLASPEIIQFGQSLNLTLQTKDFSVSGVPFNLGIGGSAEFACALDASAKMDSPQIGKRQPIRISISSDSSSVTLRISAQLNIAGQSLEIGEEKSQDIGNPFSAGSLQFGELVFPAVDLLIGRADVVLVPELVIADAFFQGGLQASGSLTLGQSEVEFRKLGETEILGTLNAAGTSRLALQDPELQINVQSLRLNVRVQVSSLIGDKSIEVGSIMLPLEKSLRLVGSPVSVTLGEFRVNEPTSTTPPPPTSSTPHPPTSTTPPPPPAPGSSGSDTLLIVTLAILGFAGLVAFIYYFSTRRKGKAKGQPVPPASLPPKSRDTAWLVVSEGLDKGQLFRIAKPDYTLGTLPENDLRLTDPSVSHQHARIKWENGLFVIYDQGTTNCTLVNGVRVGRGILHDGDKMQLGRTVIQFVEEDFGWELVWEDSKGKSCRRLILGSIVVGRSSQSDLVFSWDMTVSKEHVKFTSGRNGVLLEDLGSTNGTWVGGKRVVKVFLVADTWIQIGHQKMLVRQSHLKT